MNKLTIPNLLQVDRSDGTFVMDCDSGIALIAIRRDELAAQKARDLAEGAHESARSAKSKANRS